MTRLVVAIDTSHQKKYSCVVSGFLSDAEKLHNEIDKILLKYNQKGPFHWRKIPDKIRRSTKNEIYKAINSSNLHFTVFEHKKPFSADRIEYYLTFVPNSIANIIERWLRNKFGTVLIKIDKDYEVKGVEKGSEKFVRTLLFQAGFRLVGTNIHIRKNRDFTATIGFPNGNVLDFIASVSDRNLSKEIQLADLVLGYYLYDKTGIEKKVKFVKI
jgi:hypothetical protein